METLVVENLSRNDAAHMQHHLSITILGTLQVRRGTEVLEAHQLGGPKARQILEILLMHLGTPVSKGMIIDLLWEGAAPLAAVSTLESYVSVLRRCLQPGSGKSGVLKTTTGGYMLDASMVELDFARFDEYLHHAATQEPGEAYASLCRALSLAGAPLLGNELLPEWADAERRLHETRVVSAAVQAAEIALGLGKPSEAIGWSHYVLERDELNEQAWTTLVLALEQSGNPIQGLRAYERCRATMDRELGCRPGAELQQAQVRLLLATSASSDDFGQVVHALLAIQGLVEGHSHQAVESMVRLRAAGSVVTGYLQRALQHCG